MSCLPSIGGGSTGYSHLYLHSEEAVSMTLAHRTPDAGSAKVGGLDLKDPLGRRRDDRRPRSFDAQGLCEVPANPLRGGGRIYVRRGSAFSPDRPNVKALSAHNHKKLMTFAAIA